MCDRKASACVYLVRICHPADALPRMNPDRDLLSRIQALPAPRHLFVLPDWADPVGLDRLLDQGYLASVHQQRDEKGKIQVVMGLELTPKGGRLIQNAPAAGWKRLALKGSLAGAGFAAMSVVILYLG
jgi:hypothetical protein